MSGLTQKLKDVSKSNVISNANKVLPQKVDLLNALIIKKDYVEALNVSMEINKLTETLRNDLTYLTLDSDI